MPEPTTSSSAGFGLAANLTGGSIAVLGGFTTTEWMAIVGGLCAVIGLLIQAWSTIRKDQRDQQLHNKKMKNKGCCDDE
ncbi:holin [Acinetobacter soli]|uniref:Holin n=1 Tax=Acinetobacter soli TaxID=487316 RepID=A0AB38YTG8_9GAMM|nr:holin [Acinetobacter soli]WND04505.1 holin [Acinetobacter soli]